jgi:hypothetical protein
VCALLSEINNALLGNGPIPRDRVLHWIEAASDLRTLSKLYQFTDEGYDRIQPELGMDATYGLIQRYLLECIRENITTDPNIESRYEAAWILHTWFSQLARRGDSSAAILTATRAITELFVASNEDVRDAIETGFLEHALETATLRPYFEHWASDSRLRPAWERALQWGQAHPDYTWGLAERLRKLEEK